MPNDKSSKQEVWNIGVVKFFDHKKGFGYIASNNCHIPRREYVQDFHVNDFSFADETAKFDRALVVFKGVSSASQIRRYNKDSENDRQLGVDYFFDHEKFHLKGVSINIFHDLSISREEWLPIVITRIKNQKDRTPESTLELIQHFVNKYKKDLPGGYRHIFTKDFDSENLKPLWQQLFDELSQEEAYEELKVFPRSAIYLPVEIIEKWIDTIEIKGDLLLIDDLEFVASKLEEPLKTKIRETISQSVDDYIINLIKERSNSDFICKCVESGLSTTSLYNFDFEDILSLYENYTNTDFSSEIAVAEAAIKPFIDQHILEIINAWSNGELNSHTGKRQLCCNSSQKTILESLIAPYQRYTNTDFSDNIYKANLDRELLDFYNSLPDFETFPLNQLEEIKAKFQPLKNSRDVVVAFSNSIAKAYENLKEKNGIIDIVVFLAGIKETFPNHFAEYSAEAWVEIPIYLKKLLHEAIHEESISKFKNEFERDFNYLLSIYDDNKCDSLRPDIINTILNSGHLSILTYAVNSDFKWLTVDQALFKSLEVINAKSKPDLINIVRHEDDSLFENITVR